MLLAKKKTILAKSVETVMETILMKVKQMLRECDGGGSKRFLKFSREGNTAWHEKKLHAVYRFVVHS